MSPNSRNAPKFVIRYASPEIRDAVAAKAEEHLMSINTFINQAIAEKLGRGKAFDLLIDLATQKLIANEVSPHAYRQS